MDRRVVAYRRVAPAGVQTGAPNLGDQDDAIRAYVASASADLIGTYTENGSGEKAGRPELHRAIEHARRVGATLLIARLGRLIRNAELMACLRDARVDLAACDNPTVDRSTIDGMATEAEEQSRRNSERTKAALAAYQARGGRMGTDNLTAEGRARGSRRAGERARADADAAYSDLMATIRTLRAEGLSLRAIADRMNAQGQTTRRGAAWNPVQVSRVLGRPQ